MCAFRGSLCFSTVIGQFKYVESDVGGVKILKWCICVQRALGNRWSCANTNFAHEGRRPFNMGFKMIAIINLVGTEQTFEALECLFLEIYAKNHLYISSESIDNRKFGIIRINFSTFYNF